MNEPKKTGTEASTEAKHDLVPPTGETTRLCVVVTADEEPVLATDRDLA